MLLPAKCPECGGLIEVNSENKTANCQYCGKAFIVEEAVNHFNTYFNVTNIYNTNYNYGDGAVVNVYEDKNKDFIIEGGVLNKYQGASVDIVIPDGVIKIAAFCFQGLKIKSVIIPDSVTSIGVGAFQDCTSLTSISIPDSVTHINGLAFLNCINLTSIIIPDSITFIANGAFQNCTSLTFVTISDSLFKKMKHEFSDTPYYKAKIKAEINIVIAEQQKRIAEHKSKGLCQHCGGHFSGLFTKKCTICGLEKDY